MKRSLTLCSIVLAALVMVGCNTVSGAGKDIKAGGEVITDTADEVKEDIKKN